MIKRRFMHQDDDYWRQFILGACLILVLSACAENSGNVLEDEGVDNSRTAILNVEPADKQRYLEIREHLLKKEYPIAEAKLQAILAKYPNHSGTLANLGLLYSETGRLEKAEKVLEKSLSLDKKNPQIYLRLALVYKKQGKLVNALETYRKAIEVDANNAKAHYNIAILYDLYMQDKPSAILHLKQYQNITGKEDKETTTWIKQLERDNLAQQTAENKP